MKSGDKVMRSGDKVRIDNPQDKDDGLYGVVIEVRDGRALVQFHDGAGGWYHLSELTPA